MQSQHLVHYQKMSGLTEEQKTWTFVQFRHSLAETMLTRFVVTVVFSMVSLSQTKELKLGGQS